MEKAIGKKMAVRCLIIGITAIFFILPDFPSFALAVSNTPSVISVEDNNVGVSGEDIDLQGATAAFPVEGAKEPVQVTQNMKILLYAFVVMVIIGSFAAKRKKTPSDLETSEK